MTTTKRNTKMAVLKELVSEGRGLVTRIGKLELRVPRDRSGEFSTALFKRYARSEKALVVSSTSAINKGLHEALVQFANRKLEGPYRIQSRMHATKSA